MNFNHQLQNRLLIYPYLRPAHVRITKHDAKSTFNWAQAFLNAQLIVVPPACLPSCISVFAPPSFHIPRSDHDIGWVWLCDMQSRDWKGFLKDSGYKKDVTTFQGGTLCCQSKNIVCPDKKNKLIMFPSKNQGQNMFHIFVDSRRLNQCNIKLQVINILNIQVSGPGRH